MKSMKKNEEHENQNHDQEDCQQLQPIKRMDEYHENQGNDHD